MRIYLHTYSIKIIIIPLVPLAQETMEIKDNSSELKLKLLLNFNTRKYCIYNIDFLF